MKRIRLLIFPIQAGMTCKGAVLPVAKSLRIL